MPQVSAAVLRSTPSSTSASASIRRAAALSFSPLAALRSSEAVRSSRVIDTAAPIDAAPLKGQHRVRVSLIWESLMSHSFGPLVSGIGPADHLAQFDIPVIADLPGVGQNLQDHNEVFLSLSTKGPFGYFGEDAGIKLIRNVIQYFAFGTGPIASTGSETMAFVNLD